MTCKRCPRKAPKGRAHCKSCDERLAEYRRRYAQRAQEVEREYLFGVRAADALTDTFGRRVIYVPPGTYESVRRFGLREWQRALTVLATSLGVR